VSSLLATGNLIVKEINGTQITGQELIEYFKVQSYTTYLRYICFTCGREVAG